MKKILLYLCIPILGFSQDYQLDFNSATLDYVEMPNASSVIANKTEFTISGWVNPQMDASHSGFFGFRNNSDADFFLLQLQNSTNVEARFRNSAGVNFDILANNILDIGQWQHLAFTYDGSFIRLYKNGNIVDSTSANGTITNISRSFKIGSLDWQTTSFPMQGSTDEVRLWDAALSESTITNWMCTTVDLTHPNYSNLMGYWRLNDGMGSIVSDNSPNTLNGTLFNAIWTLSTSCFGALPTLQQTYVPDDNFENYLETHDANGLSVPIGDPSSMGNGIMNDDSVFTSRIDFVTNLYLSLYPPGQPSGSSPGIIYNITGIEEFISLVSLNIDYQVSGTLDLSYNTYLESFSCDWSGITSVDLSNNIALEGISCALSLIKTLDLTNNINLTSLNCSYSDSITAVDLRNGTNQIISSFESSNSPNLTCINVDDVAYSTANWTSIDPQQYFSADCSVTSIEEIENLEKELIKIVNVLGKETLLNKNTTLFYIYNDGTVEKKIIIE